MLEESFEQLDQKQCAAYLKKLKLPQEECTLEFLDRLIRRHLEEIDVYKRQRRTGNDLSSCRRNCDR